MGLSTDADGMISLFTSSEVSRGSQGIYRGEYIGMVKNLLRGSKEARQWRARRCGIELHRNCMERKDHRLNASIDAE
ncbi:hypothetical protein Tco_0025874 [Tanacetum coccineum]